MLNGEETLSQEEASVNVDSSTTHVLSAFISFFARIAI